MKRFTARAAAMWRHRRDDSGFTLTELMVCLSVMGVVMVLVTGAVLQSSATSARVTAAADSQLAVHTTFDQLDRQVRWAAGYSQQGVVGGSNYVEWLYTAGGTPVCNELRLNPTTQQLQLRSWTQDKLASTVTAWRVLASGVTPVDSTTGPFVFTAGGTGAFALSRLQIAIVVTAGGVKARGTATHDVTYTALNSTGSTIPATVCTEGRTSA